MHIENEYYHGSFIYFDEIDLTKSKPFRDFGPGFYLTNIFEQAAIWACAARRKSWYKNKNRFIKNEIFPDTYVYKYNVSFEGKDLKIKQFDTYDEEWLDFVMNFRLNENATTDYDIIIGPMADGEIEAIRRRYENGDINKEDTLKQIRFKKITHQLLIRTQKALSCVSKSPNSICKL